MQPLLTSKEMRKVDTFTVKNLAIPELILMEHAALAVLESLKSRFGQTLKNTKGLIIAGSGNNGGDALALARLLYLEGIENFFVVLVSEDGSLSKSTEAQLGILGKLQIPFAKKLEDKLLIASDWIVDGIFGTGLSRPLGTYHTKIIQKINDFSKDKWVVSIDLPSGLSADLGSPMPIAVKASQTVTLGFLKKGLVTGQGVDFTGRLSLAPIQIPREIPFPVTAFYYDETDAKKLPKRIPSSHKGTYGHVFIFAGEKNKEGASLLSALGAIRSGCGLVTFTGSEERLNNIRSRSPIEVMTAEYDSSLLQKNKKQVIVIGPGLGLSKQHWELVKDCLMSQNPLVLDADAISLIAENQKEAIALLKKRTGCVTVMTPHPKEAAALLSKNVEAISRDRYESATELSATYHSSFILKGKGTLISRVGEPVICVGSGDTGLAKGGSGDLLSGVLASLLAQNIAEVFALPLGVYLHGRASELLSQKYGHERANTPTEIAEQLSYAFKEIEASP